MIRIFLKILFTGFFLTFASLSYPAEWEIYEESSSGIHYYDKENIIHMPNNIIRVWRKTIYYTAGKERIIEKLGYRFKDVKEKVLLYQIDCNEKMYSILHGTFYDSKGLVIDTDDFTEDNKEVIPPDSTTKTLYNKFICKKTK